jgi:hypothetical protein
MKDYDTVISAWHNRCGDPLIHNNRSSSEDNFHVIQYHALHALEPSSSAASAIGQLFLCHTV